jgi:quercetin dioxygenase-like cupin family protein
VRRTQRNVKNWNPGEMGRRCTDAGSLGTIGVRFMIDGGDAGDRFAVVEHPMSPRALAAPLHRHTREDEYSYVLEGRVGALLGETVVVGGPGDLIFKPRDHWHTFWNAGEEPARLLEIISLRDSSDSSPSSSASAVSPQSSRKRWPTSVRDTNSRWTSTASRGSSSASSFAFPARRSSATRRQAISCRDRHLTGPWA